MKQPLIETKKETKRGGKKRALTAAEVSFDDETAKYLREPFNLRKIKPELVDRALSIDANPRTVQLPLLRNAKTKLNPSVKRATSAISNREEEEHDVP